MYLHLKNTKNTQHYIEVLRNVGDITRLKTYKNITAIDIDEVSGFVDFILNQLMVYDMQINNTINIPLSEIACIYTL